MSPRRFVVLSELRGALDEEEDSEDTEGTDMLPLARAARELGIPVGYVGGRLREQTVAMLSPSLFGGETVAFWSGHIPSPDEYERVYTALRSRGLRLINNRAEHCLSLELDLAYPMLREITAETLVARSAAECEEA